MPRSHDYLFTVLLADLEKVGIPAWLDMLRYDRATVDRVAGSIVVFRSPHEPTTARWRSFGIPVWLSMPAQYDGGGQFSIVVQTLEKLGQEV